MRLVQVASRQHTRGALRPVYPSTQDFPRFVDPLNTRSTAYAPSNDTAGLNATQPIGFIEQAEETYAYVEASYGVASPYLGIVESSCSSKIGAASRIEVNGTGALFSIDSLSRIALERCKTARCAVLLMGGLAEEHGL